MKLTDVKGEALKWLAGLNCKDSDATVLEAFIDDAWDAGFDVAETKVTDAHAAQEKGFDYLKEALQAEGEQTLTEAAEWLSHEGVVAIVRQMKQDDREHVMQKLLAAFCTQCGRNLSDASEVCCDNCDGGGS